MDNQFLSPDLFEKLCSQNMDAVGTLRQNRKGVPSGIKNSKLKKGESVCAYKDNLFDMKWKDKKDISLMNTNQDEVMIKKECQEQSIKKSKVAINYNKTMGSVDVSDAYPVRYQSARKRLKKYYLNHFQHMLDICCQNSYLLYVKMNGKISRMEFQVRLIENMISKYRTSEVTPSGRPPRSAPPTRINAPHYPKFIPFKDAKRKSYRRCTVCFKNGGRRETKFICAQCNVALCAAPCFERYHTLVDF